MTDAASTGIRRSAGRGTVHRLVSAASGGSRESPWTGRAAPLQQACALTSVLLPYGRLRVSGGAVVRYPGGLQFEEPAVRVVHLRDRQAEPVPQAPEPFAAGPGD